MTAAIEARALPQIEHLRRAIVFAEYFPPYMGSDRRIFDIVRHARSYNFEYAVVPPLRILGGRCETALSDYFDRHFVRGLVEDESGGLHGHYFNLPPFLMAAWRYASLPVAYALTLPYLIAHACRYLQQRKPEVVVVAHPSYLCGFVGIFAAILAGLPVVLDYPDAWTPLAVETAGIAERGPTARILRVIEGIIARAARRIVSISDGLSQYIRALGARGEITIVRNGADGAAFANGTAPVDLSKQGVPAQSEIILYSGRLEPWSGVSEIASTIEIVSKKRPSAHFLFVGDGSAAADLRAEIRHRGIEQHATFLGYQPFARMPALIASADLTIVPFPDTPTTRVCVPVKLFEYMLMNKPVITTDLPGIRESVDERHVHFIHSLSHSELSDAILTLLDAPEKCRAMAAASYELASERFTWAHLAVEFESVLDSAIGLDLVAH